MAQTCMKCGRALQEKSLLCMYCGAPAVPPTKCPKCGHEVPASQPRCMYCHTEVTGPKWTAPVAPTVRPSTAPTATTTPLAAAVEAMSPELVQAVLAANKQKVARFRKWRQWQHLFLILSLPVVVPSLMINYAMAKRWGSVDFLLINIDAIVLTALASRSPIFLTMMVIAWASSVMLWGIRRNQLAGGIFLGYSNEVAMCLIFGGFFLFGSLIALVYFSALGWKTWASLVFGIGLSGFGVKTAGDE
mgnify:CR=1 FL=1